MDVLTTVLMILVFLERLVRLVGRILVARANGGVARSLRAAFPTGALPAPRAPRMPRGSLGAGGAALAREAALGGARGGAALAAERLGRGAAPTAPRPARPPVAAPPRTAAAFEVAAGPEAGDGWGGGRELRCVAVAAPVDGPLTANPPDDDAIEYASYDSSSSGTVIDVAVESPPASPPG